jgi:hypothetical protein
MQKLILLVVGAAWIAVLVPPLLRSRMERRPSSSVSDFRRQLTNLQRAVPVRGMAPVRSMARPLVPGGRGDRPALRTDVRADLGARAHASRSHATAELRRPSQRRLVIQRRRNVLFGLVATTAITLFLAFDTKSDFMIYAFVFSAVSLSGYCYRLAQLRRAEEVRTVRPAYRRVA